MTESGLLTHVSYIDWLVLGLVLCGAETIVPGAFLIWIGAAALALGVVVFFWPLELTAQLLLFAGLVVILVLLGRKAYGSIDRRSKALPLSRAHGLIGKEFFLDQPIARGFGRIRVDDSVWRVTGTDCAAGAKVRVTGVEDGALLRVEIA